MIEYRQQKKIPQKMLTCSSCNKIYSEPITLSCGHTFCRQCLINQIKQQKLQEVSQQQHQIKPKYKICLCIICQQIIWKVIPDLHQNIIIKHLVDKYYPQSIRQQKISIKTINQLSEYYSQQSGYFYNKILVRVKQLSTIPMPSCTSTIQFTTNYIFDISDQSKHLVITWQSLLIKKLGLLGTMKKIQMINKQKSINRMIYNFNQLHSKKQQDFNQYHAHFYGISFVQLNSIQLLKLNWKNNRKGGREQCQNNGVKELEICNCSIFHAANYNKISVIQFQPFFRFYDHINDHHYHQQIRSMISDSPFQTRNNPEMMMYCVLRILRLPNQMRKKLLLCFDDSERISEITNWLLANQNQTIDTILNIKIPGKCNSGIFLFIIFMLFAFNLFQDYNSTKIATL